MTDQQNKVLDDMANLRNACLIAASNIVAAIVARLEDDRDLSAATEPEAIADSVELYAKAIFDRVKDAG